jgi:hypothetical protein
MPGGPKGKWISIAGTRQHEFTWKRVCTLRVIAQIMESVGVDDSLLG